MLSVLVRYRPATLRALYAVMEYDAKEQFRKVYEADTLYMIARWLYGANYPMKAYSAFADETQSAQDQRTESEIADSIISRLREVAHETI